MLSLEQMAKSNAGREGASKIWYGQIKDMPVSDASVSALKKYLSIFSDGDSVAAAQSQLAEQQKQLVRPCFPRSCARFSGGGLWYGG